MRPTTRQLEAFVAACRFESFTRAAQQMNITQSAVSVLIRQLETSVRVKLFDRSARMLRLTAAAHEMLPRAERILEQLGALSSNAMAARDRVHDRVSFAISAGLAPGLLPQLLQAMAEQHPKIALSIYDVEPTQLIPKLLEEEVELSIGHIPQIGPELTVERLAAGQMAAVFPARSRNKKRATITWDEIMSMPLITVPRGMSLRSLIDDTLAGHNKRIRPVYEASLFGTCVSMAAHGLGTAIVPNYFSVASQYPNLISLPIVQPIVRRDLMVLTKAERPLSPAARLFIEAAKDALSPKGVLPPRSR